MVARKGANFRLHYNFLDIMIRSTCLQTLRPQQLGILFDEERIGQYGGK